MADLKNDIREFILATFPMARMNKISFEESLLETGIIDSLGVLDIVNYLIEQQGIEVDEEDMTSENFANIVSIVNLVERKSQAA